MEGVIAYFSSMQNVQIIEDNTCTSIEGLLNYVTAFETDKLFRLGEEIFS